MSWLSKHVGGVAASLASLVRSHAASDALGRFASLLIVRHHDLDRINLIVIKIDSFAALVLPANEELSHDSQLSYRLVIRFHSANERHCRI